MLVSTPDRSDPSRSPGSTHALAMSITSSAGRAPQATGPAKPALWYCSRIAVVLKLLVIGGPLYGVNNCGSAPAHSSAGAPNAGWPAPCGVHDQRLFEWPGFDVAGPA